MTGKKVSGKSMNALSKAGLFKQQSQTSSDACSPASSVRRQQSDAEFVSRERMSVLGLEGPRLPFAVPPETGPLRLALSALLERWIVTTQPLLAFLLGLRAPLQRAQHVLLERWMEADFRTRQLPIFAIAAAIWASAGWMAWRSEDSATPLLRNNLATISQRVHPGKLTGGQSSGVIAEPVKPQDDAVQPGSLPQHVSPSLFLDRILGFLIPRPTPRHERHANPQLRVWADTHTGLYYCPGDNGYRRRSRGEFMSQKEAQSNYFQPASGAACP